MNEDKKTLDISQINLEQLLENGGNLLGEVLDTSLKKSFVELIPSFISYEDKEENGEIIKKPVYNASLHCNSFLVALNNFDKILKEYYS